MKRIRKTIMALVAIAGVACLLPSCKKDEKIEVKQDYDFTVQTLPYKTKVTKGEEIEIEILLVREGNYQETNYQLRYFQTDGEGFLIDDEGALFELYKPYSKIGKKTPITVGELEQAIKNKDLEFLEKVQSGTDVVNEDHSSVSEEDLKKLMDKIDELKTELERMKEEEKKEGKEDIEIPKNTLKMNTYYSVKKEKFILKYRSNCTERQRLDLVFEDSFGKKANLTIDLQNK